MKDLSDLREQIESALVRLEATDKLLDWILERLNRIAPSIQGLDCLIDTWSTELERIRAEDE